MPIPGNPNDPRTKIASALQRLWGGYQDRLPEWAKEEYGLPDIGGGFTDTFPNAFGAGVEGLYNTARDLTTVNPSVDIPIALAALATGGGALAARGITRHGDEAAEGISRVLKRGYQGDAPLAGSRGIPHASSLPNPADPGDLPYTLGRGDSGLAGWRGEPQYAPQRPIGGDPRAGFGDNAAGTIRGDVDIAPPRNDFAAMDELQSPRTIHGRNEGMARSPELPPTSGNSAAALDNVAQEINAISSTGQFTQDEIIEAMVQKHGPWVRSHFGRDPGLPGFGNYDEGQAAWRGAQSGSASPSELYDQMEGLDLIDDGWDYPSDDMSWMGGKAQTPVKDPTRDEMADWLGYVDDQKNMTDAQLAMSDADSFSPWNQYDQEMYGEFEKLIQAGVTPDEAIDILAIQYGDILDGDIWF